MWSIYLEILICLGDKYFSIHGNVLSAVKSVVNAYYGPGYCCSIVEVLAFQIFKTKKVDVGKSAVGRGLLLFRGIGTLNLFPNVSDSIKIRLKRTVSVNNRERVGKEEKNPFSWV